MQCKSYITWLFQTLTSRDIWLPCEYLTLLPSTGCSMDRLHHCGGSPSSVSQSQLILSHYLRKLYNTSNSQPYKHHVRYTRYENLQCMFVCGAGNLIE